MRINNNDKLFLNTVTNLGTFPTASKDVTLSKVNHKRPNNLLWGIMFSIILTLCFIASLFTLTPTSTTATMEGNWADGLTAQKAGEETWLGEGSLASPFQLTCATDLAQLAVNVNAGNSYAGQYLELTNNVNLSGKVWTPIGTEEAPFMGTFNGEDKKICFLTIPKPIYKCSGLFGFVENSDISHVEMYNIYINGADYVGGVVGYALNSDLNVCCNTKFEENLMDTYSADIQAIISQPGFFDTKLGTQTVDDWNSWNESNSSSLSGTNVGGIVGKWSRDAESDRTSGQFWNSGSISATGEAGGIVGWMRSSNYSITLEKVINTGSIYCSGTNGNGSGGIVGYMDACRDKIWNHPWVQIYNALNFSDITGEQYVGGICGHEYRNNGGVRLNNCVYNETDGILGASGVDSTDNAQAAYIKAMVCIETYLPVRCQWAGWDNNSWTSKSPDIVTYGTGFWTYYYLPSPYNGWTISGFSTWTNAYHVFFSGNSGTDPGVYSDSINLAASGDSWLEAIHDEAIGGFFSMTGIGGWEIYAMPVPVSSGSSYTLYYSCSASNSSGGGSLGLQILNWCPDNSNCQERSEIARHELSYNENSASSITFTPSQGVVWIVLNGGYLSDGYSYSFSFSNLCLVRTISTPSSSRSGYTQNGWWDAASGGSQITDCASHAKYLSADSTLYAHWTANTYLVTLNHNSATDPNYSDINTWKKYYNASYVTNTSNTITMSTPTRTKTILGITFRVSGWEIIGFPLQTTSGTSYTVSFNYTVPTTSGCLRFMALKSYPNNAECTGISNGYIDLPSTASSGSTSLTFTATASTTYLVFNGGTLSDGNTYTFTLTNFTISGNPKIQQFNTYDHTYWTLPTPTRTGYTFGGWYKESSFATQVIGSSTVYQTASASTLYAKWNANSYTVKLNINKPSGASNTATIPTTVGWSVTSNGLTATATCIYNTAGTTTSSGAQFPVATLTGWTFKGWATSATASSGYTGNVTSAIACVLYPGTSGGTKNLYAIWQVTTYTVTLDKNGGSGGTSSITATFDSALSTISNLPTRSGYTFTGYFTTTNGGTQYYNADGTCAKNWTETAVTTLYANWVVNTLEVDITINW